MRACRASPPLSADTVIRKGNRHRTASAANYKELFMKSTALSLDQKVPAEVVPTQSNA